ncbi:hypothetical protein C6A85_000000103945 [Mycobacterium sp. ITM-2017-0098]|nr:hypothetical protein C6A85_000000103945 [Mycobacterium sp. ITM-2017-0098]
MSSTRTTLCRVALAGVAAVPLLVLTAPAASPAPSYDSQGYLDSTARCTAPDTVVVFGSTASSRVAICSDGDGNYEYRGVRVRDGARLIVPASQSTDGAFTASNDGIDYMVTSEALVVSAEEKVLRDEPMVDFHRAGSSSAPAQAPTETPAQAPTETDDTTPTAPLPPPLPAEEGAEEEG